MTKSGPFHLNFQEVAGVFLYFFTLPSLGRKGRVGGILLSKLRANWEIWVPIKGVEGVSGEGE